MNSVPKNIFINSCQYTPVYLIQSPGATQANSYLITQANVEAPKPADNLKSFYESSANIAEYVVNNNTYRPQNIVRHDNVATGNNLKLANFLLPKTNNINKSYVLNNLVLKPNISANSTPALKKVPKFDTDRKIVKLQDVDKVKDVIKMKNVTLPVRMVCEKVVPKMKPKENTATHPVNVSTKQASEQLLKLGETYSLNQLSQEQMEVVTQAIKLFRNSEKNVTEPAYDPTKNTQYIYKVVPPRDSTVFAKKRSGVKNIKKEEIKKEIVLKQPPASEEIDDEETEIPVEPKITRSGRKVKLPKIIVPEDTPHKPKRRNTIINCFQCSAEFSSLYRLQKHYEFHPTHIPAKIHSNLFHCLLAIIKGGSEEDRTNIFIQQLEQLIVKLKSLLPCLLKHDDSKGKPCTINDDVGRLFGMNPGKYNLDVDALTCVKNKDGYCVHNPPATDPQPEIIPVHILENATIEIDDCARINSVEKWPTVNKRSWKLKQQKSDELKAKRMRLISDSDDTPIELGMDEYIINDLDNVQSDNNEECSINMPINDKSKKSKLNHVQFHSAHFDIRSSPIKTSTTLFRKFQINPDKLVEIQKLSSLSVNNDNQKDCVIPNNSENSINDIFKDIELTCKENENNEMNLKDWKINHLFETSLSKDVVFDKHITKDSAFEKEIDNVSEEITDVFNENSNIGTIKKEINNLSELQTEISNVSAFDREIATANAFDKDIDKDCVFKKELNEVCMFDKEIVDDNRTNEVKNESTLTNQGEVLNFLDSLNECLSYPSTEIRNTAVDFQMDLFSYTS